MLGTIHFGGVIMADSRKFKLEIVTEALQKCNEEGLSIKEYLIAFDEICHFFTLLGSVFTFINSDVLEKIGILRELTLKEENSNEYSKVESMLSFEKDRNKDTKEVLLGSRTLLRLHRALQFVMLYLQNIAESEDKDKMSSIAMDSYNETLSRFHPWYIRKATQMAVYALPSRHDLMQKIEITENEEETKLALLNCVNAISPVYGSTEELYTKLDLHSLP